jgi:hypothetical protein
MRAGCGWPSRCPAQIGPEGAIALAAALKINPVLSTLNLSGTTIGELTHRPLTS